MITMGGVFQTCRLRGKAMEGANWRGGPQAAAAVERLVGRIDQVRGLIENGSYAEARSNVSGRQWAASIDVSTIPEDVLGRAQAWMDAAYDSLRQSSVEPECVMRSLVMARREISG